MQCKLVQVHVNVNQDRQVDGSGSRSDKGKSGKGGKGKSKKGGKGKEREERKRPASSMVNAGTARKGDTSCKLQKDEVRHRCRQVVTRVAGRLVSTHPQRQAQRSPSPQAKLCTERGERHPVAADGASVLAGSRWQSDVSTDRDLVHQHDRTGPADSHGCKLGRSRIRVVGFWIGLDVMPNQLCQRQPITAATCKPANLEQHHWRWRGMYWSETSWRPT